MMIFLQNHLLLIISTLEQRNWCLFVIFFSVFVLFPFLLLNLWSLLLLLPIDCCALGSSLFVLPPLMSCVAIITPTSPTHLLPLMRLLPPYHCPSRLLPFLSLLCFVSTMLSPLLLLFYNDDFTLTRHY